MFGNGPSGREPGGAGKPSGGRAAVRGPSGVVARVATPSGGATRNRKAFGPEGSTDQGAPRLVGSGPGASRGARSMVSRPSGGLARVQGPSGGWTRGWKVLGPESPSRPASGRDGLNREAFGWTGSGGVRKCLRARCWDSASERLAPPFYFAHVSSGSVGALLLMARRAFF